MGNRLTYGQADVGRLSVDVASGIDVAGVSITATPAELNNLSLSGIGAQSRIAAVAITPASTAIAPLGLTLPTQALVYDVWARVTAASTQGAKTLKVGVSTSGGTGLTGGFLNGIDISTTGIKRGIVTVSTSGAGSTGDAASFYKSSTRGTLICDFSAGSTVPSMYGLFAPKSYASDSDAERSLTYEPNSSTAFAATIFVAYTILST